MLDLAIAIDTDATGTTIVETNHGTQLKSPQWPRDCDFQLVAFSTSRKVCDVVWTADLADDIGHAIRALEKAGAPKGRKPSWYHRLSRYAEVSLIRGDE